MVIHEAAFKVGFLHVAITVPIAVAVVSVVAVIVAALVALVGLVAEIATVRGLRSAGGSTLHLISASALIFMRLVTLHHLFLAQITLAVFLGVHAGAAAVRLLARTLLERLTILIVLFLVFTAGVTRCSCGGFVF